MFLRNVQLTLQEYKSDFPIAEIKYLFVKISQSDIVVNNKEIVPNEVISVLRYYKAGCTLLLKFAWHAKLSPYFCDLYEPRYPPKRMLVQLIY